VTENGKYVSLPEKDSIDALARYLNGSRAVERTELIDEQVLQIFRSGRAELRVFMTDLYIVGVADAAEILSTYDVQAIVTMSAWNGYSNEAKRFCKDRAVGLFTFKELLGAVHYTGKRFLEYTPPKRD
jgi:hypothetical protein